MLLSADFEFWNLYFKSFDGPLLHTDHFYCLSKSNCLDAALLHSDAYCGLMQWVRASCQTSQLIYFNIIKKFRKKSVGEFNDCCFYDALPPMLPCLYEIPFLCGQIDNGRYTLVLDLDETLVHYFEMDGSGKVGIVGIYIQSLNYIYQHRLQLLRFLQLFAAMHCAHFLIFSSNFVFQTNS